MGSPLRQARIAPAPSREDRALDPIAGLLRFIDASSCPAPATDTITADFGAAGFQALDPGTA